ncbi:MAG: hypothetical protein IKQ66_05145 [Treponema sp.]|nr:hypothetical protein [Treponema sp.]
MVVLEILICVFNLVMWLLAIVRFRKVFSTDDIVQKTRDELDKMMMDINRNAERNVDLIEDRIRKLKEISAETDRHIEILRGELANTEKSKSFQSRMIGAESKKRPSAVKLDDDFALESPEEPVKKPRTATRKTSSRSATKESAVTSKAVEIQTHETKSTEQPVPVGRPRGPLMAYQYEQKSIASIAQKKSGQPQEDSFSQEIDDIVRKSSFEIEPSDSAGSVGPEIIVSPNPIRPKKSKKDQVLDLAATGMTVEEIARQLKTTTTEVEFILDMS